MNQNCLTLCDNQSVISESASVIVETDVEDKQSQIENSVIQRKENDDSIVLPESSTSFDEINIENSKNVNFGNRTVIYGPVTIQQLLQTQSDLNDSLSIQPTQKDIVGEPKENDSKSDDEGFQNLHNLEEAPEVNVNICKTSK